MPIVPVKLVANDGEIITYAMLDSCCTGTFFVGRCSSRASSRWYWCYSEHNEWVHQSSKSKVHQTKVVTGLVVTDLNENNKVNLPRTFSRSVIPALRSEVPNNELQLLLSKTIFRIWLINYLCVYRKLL